MNAYEVQTVFKAKVPGADVFGREENAASQELAKMPEAADALEALDSWPSFVEHLNQLHPPVRIASKAPPSMPDPNEPVEWSYFQAPKKPTMQALATYARHAAAFVQGLRST